MDKGFLVDLEDKALEENADAWTLTGYASVFGNTDLGDDIVVKGAFAESLKTRTPLLLFNHKMEDAPIGTVVDAKEDSRGLWFKAELPKDDEFVRGRIAPQIKRRGLKGVSIGFKAKEVERKGGVRLIKKAALFEISIVNVPMNPLAAVDGFKSNSPLGLKAWDALSTRDREGHLKSLGLSNELARRLIAADREGRGAKGLRDAADGREAPAYGSILNSFADRLKG